MRHIYLIRHCRPEFPNGVECCISRTDYSLSKEGLQQARRLGNYFSGLPLSAVYSSTLNRSVQTAEAIARPGVPVFRNEALREIDCGIWEGLTLAEIKEKFPEQYAMRGIDPVQFVPKKGERLADGLARFRISVEQIISESTGDIAIVAHSSVNRLFLCTLLNKELRELYTITQPYGCINEIKLEQHLMLVKRTGCLPDELPGMETIRSLWKRYHTPEDTIAHCRAVATKALLLAKELARMGYELNEKLIYSAALLHDFARPEPDHAALGARRLAREGYRKAADIIACHHDLKEDENDPVTEKTIVFLADKLVSGIKEVSLVKRFEESAQRCVTAEAKASHKIRYEQAAAALLRVQRLTGKEKSDETTL